MHIDQTLTPGGDHYRTRRIGTDTGIETRARIIPNQPKTRPALTPCTVGRRGMGSPIPKQALPPLSVPIPKPITLPQPRVDSPDMDDIRLVQATNFLQFTRLPGTQVMRVTWDELDNAMKKPQPVRRIKIPDIPDTVFEDVLRGRGDREKLRCLFGEDLEEFVDECFSPMRLSKITEADVEKFLVGKPQLGAADIEKRLLEWLRDLRNAFLPRLADELPPHRAWDHKIELVPGNEPPYQKNRPLSPAELKVVRKWLDDNLSKGLIRESRARCAAPLLLAAKPGGGVRVCQDYRGLNNVTIKNRYPLPLIRETLDAIFTLKSLLKLTLLPHSINSVSPKGMSGKQRS